MKVVIFSPTYFHSSSFIGGAERYVEELARVLAKRTKVTLVSFSKVRNSSRHGLLQKEIYRAWWYWKKNSLNPFNPAALREILKADAVFVHGVCTFMSDLACWTSAFFRKPVFVMDHGGGGEFVLNVRLPVYRFYDGAVAQSCFAKKFLPRELQSRTIEIKGGIDLDKFFPKPSLRERKRILFVGRMLPHKGVDQLVRACARLASRDWKLVLLGSCYNTQYQSDLKKLAEGMPVEWIEGADDQRLLLEYQKASVLVLPSTRLDCYGNTNHKPELMGFVLMEAQACGTPVICTDAGAMEEFVDNGKTGWIVPQNDPEALAAALNDVFEAWEKRGEELHAACRLSMQRFSWENVANQWMNLVSERSS